MPATTDLKQAAGDVPAAIRELERSGSLGHLRRIELLEKRRDTGKITLGGFSFVHELDARAQPPEKLVHGLEHHPATDKRAKYYFISEAKNRRKVAGENRHTNGHWHPESGTKEVRLGEDVVGYVRRLSCVITTDDSSEPISPNWIMMEYTLVKKEGADDENQFVLSVMHKSHYKKRKKIAASSDSAAAPAGTVEAEYGQQRDAEVVEEEARDGEKTAIGFTVTSITEEPEVDRSIVAVDKRPGYATILAAHLNNFGGKEPPQLMQLAREGGIQSILTNVAYEKNTTILQIVSKRVLGKRNFEDKVLPIINGLGTPPYCMEDRISLKLFPSTLSHEMIQQELGNIVPELEKFADVTVLQQRSIISLIGDAQQSTLILSKLSSALLKISVKWQKLEQRVSKVMSITFVVNDSGTMRCLEALDSAFFEKSSPVRVNSSSAPAASSGSKRKVAEDEDHPEARPAGRRQTNPETPCSVLEQTDEDDEEVDLEFNNNTIPVNLSTEISSEPIHYNHPEPPQDMAYTGGRWTPEEEIQMLNGVQAHQDLNNYIHMIDEPELRTEVMSCAVFANPAYETWCPTEDGCPIDLGSDEYTLLDIGPLWSW